MKSIDELIDELMATGLYKESEREKVREMLLEAKKYQNDPEIRDRVDKFSDSLKKQVFEVAREYVEELQLNPRESEVQKKIQTIDMLVMVELLQAVSSLALINHQKLNSITMTLKTVYERQEQTINSFNKLKDMMKSPEDAVKFIQETLKKVKDDNSIPDPTTPTKH